MTSLEADSSNERRSEQDCYLGVDIAARSTDPGRLNTTPGAGE